MSVPWAWLVEPFGNAFMVKALVVALAVAVSAAVLSCFLVLRGWSLMGDAVSHAVLPGVVIGANLSIAPQLGAFLTGLLCAVSANALRKSPRVKPDAAIAIVFSGLFALGIVLMTAFPTGQDLMHLLFGNMLGVPEREAWITILIAVVVTVVVLMFRRDLLLVSFDAAHARAIGLPVRGLEWLLLVMLALTTTAALSTVGVVLAVGMLIAPGAVAMTLCRRFDRALGVAVTTAVGSSALGLVASFHLDSASAPTIIVVQSFVVAFAIATRIARNRRRAMASALSER